MNLDRKSSRFHVSKPAAVDLAGMVRTVARMTTPPGPQPDWLEPVLKAAFDSFVRNPAGRRRIVSATVPGATGSGFQGLRVFAGFSGRADRPAGVQLLIIEGPRITAESLRQVPMAELERAYLGETGSEKDPATLPRLERVGRSPEVFSRLVAEHYRAWQQLDPHPAKRMAEEYGLKQTTVHSWIREARLRGVLPAAERKPRSQYLALPGSDAGLEAGERGTSADTGGVE